VSLSPRKRALFVAALVVLALSPLLAAVGIEASARLYFWGRFGVPGKTYGIWRSDPELGGIQKPYGYNTTGETPGSLRIIAYGGSTTF